MAPRPEDDDRHTMKWNPETFNDRGERDQSEHGSVNESDAPASHTPDSDDGGGSEDSTDE